MDINQAKEILAKNNGAHINKIFVPSLKEDISFLPLTIGQKKTIAKIIIQNNTKNEDIDSYNILLAVINSLSQNKIDFSKITEFDRILIITEIIQNNFLDTPTYNIKCGQCKNEYTHKLDLNNFSKGLKEIKVINTEEYNFVDNDNNIKIEYNLPSVEDILKYKVYLNDRKSIIKASVEITDEQKENILKNIDDYSFNNEYPVMFIKKVFINDDEIEKFNELSIKEKLEFFDVFDYNAFFGEKGIFSMISIKYENITDKLLYDYNCPFCKNIIKEILDYKSFFYF